MSSRTRIVTLSLLSAVVLLVGGVALLWGISGIQGFSLGPSESATVVAAPTDEPLLAPAQDPGEAAHSEDVPSPVREPQLEPLSPELRAAYEDGTLSDLDGLFFDHQGIDPYAWRPDPQSCRGLEHGVIVDRAVQRGWYCTEEKVLSHFVLTSSDLQPDPGDYSVYAKNIQAWSTEFGPPSTMTHFVAFTRGKFQGARIAFHSVPKYSDGSWAQPLDSVGTMEHFGDSSGCIRLLPQDAEAVWDFLELGGTVRVIS